MKISIYVFFSENACKLIISKLLPYYSSFYSCYIIIMAFNYLFFL